MTTEQNPYGDETLRAIYQQSYPTLSTMAPETKTSTNSQVSKLSGLPDKIPEGTGQRVGTALIDIIIIIVIVVIGFIAAIMLAVAAGAITRINGKWRDDPNLSKAHRFISWATTILWLGGFFLISFYVIFFWVFSAAYNYIFALTEFLVAVVFFIAAVLAFVGIGEIRKSPLSEDTPDEAEKAVRNGTIAAVLAIIISLGLTFWLIYSYIKFERQGGVEGDIKFKLQTAQTAAEFAG